MRLPLIGGVILGLVLGPLGAIGSGAHTGNGSGYTYIHDDVPEVPWSIHIVKIDRHNPNLHLTTSLANGGSIGLTPLAYQIALLPEGMGRAIAGINGDFYYEKKPYVGDPKGIQISRGELISAPCDWTCLWIDRAGDPRMGRVKPDFTVTWPNGSVTPIGLNEVRPAAKCVLYSSAVGDSTFTSGGVELDLELKGGSLPLRAGEEYDAVVRTVRSGGNMPVASDRLVLSVGPRAKGVPVVKPGAMLHIRTATIPSLEGAVTALSGGPALLHQGEIQVGWSALRHPRSAVGWNQDYIFMVQVDGRQKALSVGMTYSELAQYLRKLGCTEAMNLDGGGSSTFWVLGQVINSPSEGQARGVANGLILVQMKDQGQAASSPSP